MSLLIYIFKFLFLGRKITRERKETGFLKISSVKEVMYISTIPDLFQQKSRPTGKQIRSQFNMQSRSQKWVSVSLIVLTYVL